jgi:ComF family protein
MLSHSTRLKNNIQMKTLTKKWALGALNTLLPPSCLACDTPVESDGQFCLVCFKRTNFVSAPFCQRCGVPLPYGAAAGPRGDCARCELEPPAFTAARSALRYDEAAQALIIPFKYSDRTELARGIATLMERAGAALLSRADILVPVPLHKTRLQARRYNQSALLAAILARKTGKHLVRDGLLRVKATAPLVKMGLAARQAELADAITVSPKRAMHLIGKTVLLIDDVMTSGTTAQVCAAALLAAGVAQVDVLTATRVADPRFD